MNFLEAIIKVWKNPFYAGGITFTLMWGILNLISTNSKIVYFTAPLIWIILWAFIEMSKDVKKNANVKN